MMLEALEWLGHSGFRVTAGGATIYVDPYRVDSGPTADLVLVTHPHYDHFSPLVLERISGPDTWLVGPAGVTEQVEGNAVSLTPGEVLDVGGGIEITGVAAYNTSKRDGEGRPFHPPEADWLGYELRVRGERLYHAGDTDVIPEMDTVAGVDVALLPVSGTYVMTASEAAEAARRIQPRVAVPMHWGAQIGSWADARRFAELAPVEVAVLERAAGAKRRAA